MIEIILTVCLISNANICKDVSLNFMGDPAFLTPQKCFHNGQVEITKWIDEHPKWRVAKWKCGSSERKKIDI